MNPSNVQHLALVRQHPEHSMKSWHSFYHKKVNILGPIVTQPNPPPETFTPEEEEALVTFLANGGSFMVDTTLLLYNVSTVFWYFIFLNAFIYRDTPTLIHLSYTFAVL